MLFASQLAAGPVHLYKGYDFDGGASLADFGSKGATLLRKNINGSAASGTAPVVGEYNSLKFLKVFNQTNAFLSDSVAATSTPNGFSIEMLLFKPSTGDTSSNSTVEFNRSPITSRSTYSSAVVWESTPNTLQLTLAFYSSAAWKSYSTSKTQTGIAIHVVNTFSPSEGLVRRYVNGVFYGQAATAFIPDESAGQVVAFRPVSGMQKSSNVAIYDRVLSASEILANYSAIGLNLASF
jgi:hypothetical protein